MNYAGGRALILALFVVSVAMTGGIVMTGSTAAADGDAVQFVVAQQNATDEDQNETTPHRNPDDYAEDGDLESVEGWLSDRLAAQLGDGAIQLSEGEYELASEYVGEEYRDRLGQYVDVAGQTEGESHEEQFEEAGEQQARLSEAVAEYRETKDEYEAAREAGNEDRARELGRELETLADEIESLGGSVRERYDEIEAGTGADLSEPDAAIENVTTEIRSEQAIVREQQFTETELSLTPDQETISFLEPLVATGELRTADGASIANEEVRLDVGNHTERVTTDSAGGFTLEYRPTDESLSADELRIQYVPESQSTYLGDETNVSVSIDQVDPTVSLEEAPSELSYGEQHAVAGELRVDGIAVDNVSLAVTVDGERIGTAPVQNGVFETSASLPAGVEDGQQELTVRLPFEDRALATAADGTNVTVRETESDLSVEGLSDGNRAVTVNGTLATADGDGVRGESVEIQIDGVTVGTVTTDAGGTFEETVSVPNSIAGGEVTVTAVYDGSGSNIEAATAETVVTIGDADTQLSSPLWLAAGFLAVIAVGLGVWWYRRAGGTGPGDGAAGDGEPTAGGPTAGTRSADTSSPSPDAVKSLLERASEQLSNGRPDDAARTGYAAVRRALASRIDGSDALTHWEFYRRFRTADAADAALLRDITQEYERAAFDPGGVSPDEAASVLERARQLCDLDESSDGGVPADD